MGMFFLIPVFYFSHIPQASFSEFEVDGHFYTSPNQKDYPPSPIIYSTELPKDAPPSELRKRVWALQSFPYLPFLLFSPFRGAMTSCLETPLEQIPLVDGKHGYQLPDDVSKSWTDLERSCRQVAFVLRSFYEVWHPKAVLNFSEPPKPTQFGYLKGYTTAKKARVALSESIDAFVVLLAYVSFCIAICRRKDDPGTVDLSLSEQPQWVRELSLKRSRTHPEFLQLLANSPISDFSAASNRVGAIINVAQCSWLSLVPYMLTANVPIWLYWGIPPVLLQPLDTNALIFAPRSHPQSRAPPLPVFTPPQSVNLPIGSAHAPPPPQSVGPPVGSAHAGPPPQSVGLPVRSAHGGSGQLPGETWKDFMVRQNERRKKKLLKENNVDRLAREDRERTAAKRSCPGRKGPTVYIWEIDEGVWERRLITRGDVESQWGQFKSSQAIYNSIDNCWDLCREFDAGTAGKMYEYDSNDSDDDTYYQKRSPKHGTSRDMVVDPMLHADATPASAEIASGSQSLSTPSQVASDFPMLIDPCDSTPLPSSMPAQVASCDTITESECPAMDVEPTRSDLASQSISTPAEVVSDPTSESMVVDSHNETTLPLSMPVEVAPRDLQHPSPQPDGDGIGEDEDDEDPYNASMQDVPSAYSFAALNLVQMPFTTLEDLLYYRFGFSLNESPYTGIPPSTKAEIDTFRSWEEVCRAVGGQQLETSVVNGDAIRDFLSILVLSADPFKEMPGKYWDLSPFGKTPIVGLNKVFIWIEEKQFGDKIFYIIHPRFLHPSRDSSWSISVDSMTALECIRRGLGPHTVDIANFLISHGVQFHAVERVQPESFPISENPPDRPHCQYLGHRPAGYSFDLADFAGYEVLRDSFLRSQSHGPLALREGGIIARLAREVLPNTKALSGPSSEALNGDRARFICNNSSEIYVADNFLDAELGLICGTYSLGTHGKGGNGYLFLN
jgi:hypothetical protein